ncbi:MAG: tetratricopeptide repeat protein [Verrucomicrobiia bacterium]
MPDIIAEKKRTPAWYLLGLVAIVLLGLVLRSYRITGWIMDNDESHFLIHALRPSLLVVPDYPTHARPDCLYVLLCIPSIHLLGPNELGMRIWPVLFGTLSIAAIAVLVWHYTHCYRSALWAAGVLAVFPLHVFLSTKATPDVISVFFLICALIALVDLSRPGARTSNFILLGTAMALAILAKLTALCLWFFVLLTLPFVIPDKRNRVWGYLSLFLALLPVVAMIIAAKWNGSPIHFFEEERQRAQFGFSLDRIASQVGLFWRFYADVAVLAGVGVWIAIRKRRELPALLLPLCLATLALVFVAPYFRSHIRDVIFLVPSLWPLLGLSVAFFTGSFLRTLTLVVVVAANLALTLIGVPGRNYSDSSWSGRSTAVPDRPPGWPSHAISSWVASHLAPDEGLLVTGLGYTDAFVISLKRKGIRYHSAISDCELLRDPANKITYLVFVDDPTIYADGLYRYAGTHFSLVREPAFPGYVIFDCRKNGQFVAYPDALNGAKTYASQGARLARQGDYPNAITCFQTALQQEPGLLDVKKLLMTCYLNTGQKNEALHIGREIAEADPRDPESNLNLAILYHELGMTQEARAQCEHNIQHGIAPAISYGILAQTLEQSGDLGAARDAYEMSLRRDPRNPVTLELLRSFDDRHPHVAPSSPNPSTGSSRR